MRRLSAALLLCVGAGAAQAQTTVSGPVTFGDGLAVSGAGVVSLAPGSASGFVNRLRNAGLTQWYSGAGPISIGTSGGWGAEGVFVVPGGAAVTAERSPSALTAPQSFFSEKITGASGVTGLVVRFVADSLAAAPLAGRTLTFQVPILNQTGAVLSPALTVKHAGAPDDFSSPATDLSAVSLQSCADGATCVLAYTLTVPSAGANGLSLDVDFGNNFATSGQSLEIGGGFDLRATPGQATGPNNAPPPPEIPTPAAEVLENGRFYRSSYDNGTAPGSATPSGADEFIGSGATAGKSVRFGAPMRCDPLVTAYSPATGASGLARDLANGVDVAATIVSIGQSGFVWSASPSAGTTAVLSEHWTADCRIPGA